jgi:hypothetical protein
MHSAAPASFSSCLRAHCKLDAIAAPRYEGAAGEKLRRGNL